MTGQPYQVMPPLDGAEYDALKASIAAGYDPARPVVVDENGAVLDGHHRQQACAELGITPPTVVLPGLTEDQKHDYAMRANLACRHLTQLQKRELIAAELERDPGRSDREIGRLCGADHKTVGSVRRDLSGEFPHPEHRNATPEEARAWAEEITAKIREQIHEQDMTLLAALLAGVPSAEIAGMLTMKWQQMEEATDDDSAIRDGVREALLEPRLRMLKEWPGGPIADQCMEEDDQLKVAYVTALAAGLLS